MMWIRIEHNGLPSLPGPLNAVREIDTTKSWSEISATITNSVGENLKKSLLLCEPQILITYKDGRNCILDGDFMKKFSDKDDVYLDGELVKVFWKFTNDVQPSVLTQNALTPTDAQTQANEQCNHSFIASALERLESIIDAPCELYLEKIGKSDLDVYIPGLKQKARTDQTGLVNLHSISKFSDFSTNPSSHVFVTQESPSSSSIDPNTQVVNILHSGGNAATLKQIQVAPKRPNQSEDDATIKRRGTCTREQNQPCPNPTSGKIYVEGPRNKMIEILKPPPNASDAPLISNFNSGEKIHFINGLNPIDRDRYLSDFRKRVPRMQGKKPDDNQFKESLLPALELPCAYQQKVIDDEFVIMGLVCVMECRNLQIEGGGEGIDYHLVGYKQFRCYPDETDEMVPMSVIYPENGDGEAEQLIFKITKRSDGNNAYTLIAHPYKVKDRLYNKIGPVMFRLTTGYIQAAKDAGFTFGTKRLAHRYAAYLFKYDENQNAYVPDYKSLGLSGYVFKEERLHNSVL